MLIPFLIQEMSKLITDNQPVDANELDELVNLKNIPLEEEHRQFLIKYGNCQTLLTNRFGDFSFEQFKDHYLDDELFYTDRIPSGTAYIGTDFGDELLCIDNETRKIYTYYDQKKDLFYYDNLESLLFTCFIQSDYFEKSFDKICQNIKIFSPKAFLKKNEKHKICDIQGDSYYLIDNKLYLVRNHIYETHFEFLKLSKIKHSFIMANIFEGGVIDDYLSCRVRPAHR